MSLSKRVPEKFFTLPSSQGAQRLGRLNFWARGYFLRHLLLKEIEEVFSLLFYVYNLHI
jgi:hypothetical protein